MKKDKDDFQTYLAAAEGACSGWGHEPCDGGTDFRQAWIYEKCYMLFRAAMEINMIISATKDRIPVNADMAQNCRSKACGGCIDFPKQINFDPRRIFSFYCPKYHIENLCSFRAISYYCDSLKKYLLHLSLDGINVDFLMEIEVICQEIYKKTFILAGAHNKAVAVKAQYIKGPGATSRERGKGKRKLATDILKAYGGIQGYDARPRGFKKPVREKIEKKLELADPQTVYKILKDLRKEAAK
jgi:hypothetical protein